VRVLKDNPDVTGNLQKIKQDKNELLLCQEELLSELKDLSYANFRNYITDGLD
jgi:hypothetical protein